MTIRAIAWDIDGTLVDSEPLHQEALVTICERWQVDLSDIPEDRFCGVHMPDIWLSLASRMPSDLSEQVWHDAIVDYYVNKCATLEPVPGAIEVIDYLAGYELAQVCVSNSGRRIVDANMLSLQIKERMVFSISLDDVEFGKPHPEPYATACTKLNLRPTEVLAVEDSISGLRSARAAGLITAYYSPTGGTNSEASFSVSDLRQLKELVSAHTSFS